MITDTGRMPLVALRVALLLAALAAPLAVVGAPAHLNSCRANFDPASPRLPYKYCQPDLPLPQRVADLVLHMTTLEKTQSLDSIGNPRIDRLGVPTLPGGEGLHGVASGCGAASSPASTGCPTSFPSPPSLGSTFDKQLWSQVGQTIGTEARALYNQGVAGIYLFTPNVNPSRDQRWGRAQEVPSEDALVCAEYGGAYVAAFQARNQATTPLKAAATAKHWAFYDLEGYLPRTDQMPRPPSAACDTPVGCERWNFDASPPFQQALDFYLSPFKPMIDVQVASVMCSYNAAYGVPMCASNLTNSILRNAWGWQGFVVSDCSAIEIFQDASFENCKPPFPLSPGQCTPDVFGGGHNFTTSIGDTARAALDAGTDFNCGPFFKCNLYNSLQSGDVTAQQIDIAVARVYRTHFELGLLDPEERQPYNALGADDVDTAASRALALRAAEEGMVLLVNRNATLPLTIARKTAFIGPHATATQAMLANYHGSNTLVNSHSPLQVAHDRGWAVDYALGCRVCDMQPAANMPCERSDDDSGFATAIQAATAAEDVVLFLGLDQTSEAENFDRQNLTLPSLQARLLTAVLDAVDARQTRVIVVLMSGGTVSSELWLDARLGALLHTHYAGQLGGDAIINTLLGLNNPAGRMTATMYYNNFTQRDMRDMDLSHAGGITHAYFMGPVLFPFGAGLSYSEMSTTLVTAHMVTASATNVTASNSTPAVRVVVKAEVFNAGPYAGDHVLLLFAHRTVGVASDSCPHQRLLDFVRVRALQVHERQPVLFEVPLGNSACWSEWHQIEFSFGAGGARFRATAAV